MAKRGKKSERPYLTVEVTTTPADEETARAQLDALVRLVCANLRARLRPARAGHEAPPASRSSRRGIA